MSLTNSPFWMAQTGGASFYDYEIDNSARMTSDNSSYLQRTPSVSGNRDTWTFSCWIKRTELNGGGERIFGAGDDLVNPGNHNNTITLYFNDHNLRFRQESGGSANMDLRSYAVYRDTSAWYHIVAVYDSTNATAGDRARMYVNGERITALSINDPDPGSGTDSNCMRAGHIMRIGRSTSGYHNHNLAEVHWVDGSALEPTSFGETKSGVWIPKEYSGSHGTNGVYLKFANSAAFGTDSSGNGNTFSTGGLTTHDQLPDSPTNNFNTFSDVIRQNSGSLSEGALKSSSVVGGSSNYGPMSCYNVKSGKWYFEFRITGGTAKDIYAGAFYARTDNSIRFGKDMTVVYDGLIYVDGSVDQSGLANPATNDVFGFAVDVDNSTCQVYRNGSTYGTQTSFSGSSYVDNGFMGMGHYHGSSSSNSTAIVNYGQDSTFAGATTAGGNSDSNGYGDFKYAPPSGFLAMCSQNLPEPTFSPADDSLPSDHFNTVLWTGTGSGQSITGLGFQPDWLWFKQRNGTSDHALMDSVRGVNLGLRTNSTGSELSSGASNDLVSFDSDGFTTGTPQNFGSLGSSGFTINTWGWKGGNGTVTNNDGSVTTTVSANPDAGVSIVGYSGSGTTSTFGHGLGTPVDCMIIKRRNGSTNWIFKHKDLANGTTSGYMQFDTTTGRLDDPNAGLTGTNDTTFTISNSYGTQNTSGGTYVAYCFAGREGFSRFGKYVANNNSDGPFVYLGFKPAFLIIRSTASARDWLLYDNKLHTYNNAHGPFQPNTSGTPYSTSPNGTYTLVDFLANGFKLRVGSPNMNWDSATFVYMAFAEQPFKYANGE